MRCGKNSVDGAFSVAFDYSAWHTFSNATGAWVPPISGKSVRLGSRSFDGNVSIGVWKASAVFSTDYILSMKRIDVVLD